MSIHRVKGLKPNYAGQCDIHTGAINQPGTVARWSLTPSTLAAEWIDSPGRFFCNKTEKGNEWVFLENKKEGQISNTVKLKHEAVLAWKLKEGSWWKGRTECKHETHYHSRRSLCSAALGSDKLDVTEATWPKPLENKALGYGREVR
jgi:hypothetical protein